METIEESIIVTPSENVVPETNGNAILIDETITIDLSHMWEKFYLYLDEINPYRSKIYDLEYPKFKTGLEEYFLLYPTFTDDIKFSKISSVGIDPECMYYFYMFTEKERINI